jgi:hypothetical protein
METSRRPQSVWETHKTFVVGLFVALFIGVPFAYAIGGTVFGSGLSETPRHEQNLQRLSTDFQRLQRIVDEAKASQAVNRKLQVSVLIDIAKSKAKDEQEKEDVNLEEVKRLIDKAYCLEGIYYDAEVNWGTIILDDICSFQEYPVEEVFTMEPVSQ